MRRDDFTFVHQLRVRWAEVDRQDVVFNGHYFLYFDIAITEYWRALGFAYPNDIAHRFGSDLYAVKATAEYHGSALYDDIIDVCCRTARFGRSSMQCVLGIYRGEVHLTSGELIYVNADPRTRKSTPWPEQFVQAVFALERLPPETASGTPR